jgi:acetylglutamate kinase
VIPEIRVVKIGGHEVDDTGWLARLGAAAAAVDQLVVVHGGGKEVSELQRALGAEPEWRDGLRFTTPEALRAVQLTLSGSVNKRLVSALISAGADAIGISGEDGALVRARPLRAGALGRTGEVVAVRALLLRTLISLGMVPVVSPVSRGEDGGALNVNADDAAAAVAAALQATELLFVSNVAGVLRGGEPITEIGADEVEELVSSGVVTGGMEPKLRAAIRALEQGVGLVRVGGLRMITDASAGTRIQAALSSPNL